MANLKERIEKALSEGKMVLIDSFPETIKADSSKVEVIKG